MIRNASNKYICLIFLIFISYTSQAQNIVDGTQLKVKQENGTYIYYDTNGNLFTGRVYGKIQTISLERIDTAYINNGKMQGLWKFYYGYGSRQVWKKGEYKDGKQEGLWKFYWVVGNLLAVGKYKDGKEEGLWKFYHLKGQLWEKGEYKDGKREGLWKFYDRDGKLEKQEMF